MGGEHLAVVTSEADIGREGVGEGAAVAGDGGDDGESKIAVAGAVVGSWFDLG